MKNLIVLVFLTTSVVVFGQNDKRKMKGSEEFTTEQQAILKTKKMTLALDLNNNQQSQILALNKKWIQEKASMRSTSETNNQELSADQKFDLMNKKLDYKISQQQELKKVLDNDQYALWKESMMKRQHKSKAKKKQLHKKEHKS